MAQRKMRQKGKGEQRPSASVAPGTSRGGAWRAAQRGRSLLPTLTQKGESAYHYQVIFCFGGPEPSSLTPCQPEDAHRRTPEGREIVMRKTKFSISIEKLQLSREARLYYYLASYRRSVGLPWNRLNESQFEDDPTLPQGIQHALELDDLLLAA